MSNGPPTTTADGNFISEGAGMLVPGAGLEPALLSKMDFESIASTDFATRAGCTGSKFPRKPVCRTQRFPMKTMPGLWKF